MQEGVQEAFVQCGIGGSHRSSSSSSRVGDGSEHSVNNGAADVFESDSESSSSSTTVREPAAVAAAGAAEVVCFSFRQAGFCVASSPTRECCCTHCLAHCLLLLRHFAMLLLQRLPFWRDEDDLIE